VKAALPVAVALALAGCGKASIYPAGDGGGSGTTTGGSSSTSTGSTSSGSSGTTTGAGGTGTSSSGGSSTTGGSTSSGGSSSGGTGGTTGGIPDAGCATLGLGEFLGPCSPQVLCACGLACVHDAYLASVVGFDEDRCEYPCVTSADCVNPGELCSAGGGCTLGLCGPLPDGDAGPNGLFWGPCSNAGTNDGTCVPAIGPLLLNAASNFDIQADIFTCMAAGTSVTTCDLSATRNDPTRLCAQGLGCNPLGAGLTGTAGICSQGCTPGSNEVPCPSGQVCSSATQGGTTFGLGPHGGYCFAGGAGGCAVGLQDQSYLACQDNSQCNCPNLCVFDPGLGIQVCEAPCTTGGYCTSLGATCVNGFCAGAFCVRSLTGDVPGAYLGVCDSADAGDGTCVPRDQFGAGGEFGLCLRGGVADGGCDPPLQLLPTPPIGPAVSPGGLCPVGQVCIQGQSGNANACSLLCDPQGNGAPCASGEVCLLQSASLPDLGICGSCVGDGISCLRDRDCCSGSCSGPLGSQTCS